MNLSFHLVDVAFTPDLPRVDLEEQAYAALVTNNSDVASLGAMAELVDWELGCLGFLSGLGERCRRALRQRLLRVEDVACVESLANGSGVVADLLRELTRHAGSVEGPSYLVA